MLKKITRILSGFALALAFVFTSDSIAEDYMQLCVKRPIKNTAETTKSELDSVSTAPDYMQLYVNPPITNKVSSYIPERQLPFGTTLNSGMYYDFYFHYQNPKPYPKMQRMLRDFLR